MSNDAEIKKYRQAVDVKRKELGIKPKLAYTTNALLDLDGERVNLNTLMNDEQCVFVTGKILGAVDIIKRANDTLGTDVTLRFGDFTAEQWIGDIKLRVQLLTWEAKKKKLTAMDKKLSLLMSDDAKTADAIADIAAALED